MMRNPSTRRYFLGAMTGVGASLLHHTRQIEASGLQQDYRRRSAYEEGDPGSLSIAILDTHWVLVQSLFASFAETTGITLDVTALRFDDLYNQISLALTQRASTFDIVFLLDPWIPQFATFLYPVEGSPEFAAVLPTVANEIDRYPVDAPPCAIPWLGECQFFGVHPEWLRRAGFDVPTTWSDVLETTTALSQRFDSERTTAAFAIQSSSARQIVESFLPILRGYGGDLIDVETSIPQLDTEAARAAVELFLSLAAFSPVESPAANEPTNTERFARGEICMMANLWSSDFMNTGTDEIQPDSGSPIAIRQPAQPGIEHLAMSGFWLAAIPVGSLRIDLALAFANWLGSDESQQTLAALALPPVRLDVARSLSKDQITDRLKMSQSMMMDATARVRTPFYVQLEQLLAKELSRALDGEISGFDAMMNANVAARAVLVREGVLGA